MNSKIYTYQDSRSTPCYLRVLANSLVAYCTKENGARIVTINKHKIQKEIANINLSSSIDGCSFSQNGRFFAFFIKNSLTIIEIISKKIINTIEINEDIEIVSFDLSSSYTIVATKSGEILQYKIDASLLISRLYSFANEKSKIDLINKKFVTTFAFYGKKFACSSGGYDGTIFIIDLLTQTDKHIITTHKKKINTLNFLDEETLLYGTDDGKIELFFLNKRESFKSITTPFSTIKQLLIMLNPNFIMVSGNSNTAAIIDLKNFKTAHRKYVEFDAKIEKMAINDDGLLIVALQNSQILFVDLPTVATLRSYILHNSFTKAFELIQKEPMLQGSTEHKDLEINFERHYRDATKALIDQNHSLATKILDIYKDVKCKEVRIRELFLAFSYYPRFQELFLEKKYPLAHIICSKFEPLKKTPEYKKMEHIFKLTFLNAQRYIIQKNLPAAKDLLKAYITVSSKKELINLLLNQNKEFIALLNAIQNREFQTIYTLIDKNEIFRQIPHYIALENEIKESLLEVEANLKNGHSKEAKELLKTINSISHITEDLEELHKKYDYVLLLQRAYEESNFKNCYELLDIYPYLKSTDLGTLLENHWFKLIQKCEELALLGKTDEIKEIVAELIDVYPRGHKIADLLRVSYRAKITLFMNKKDFKNSELAIYSYIDLFGIENELKNIMIKFEQLSPYKLALTYTKERTEEAK